MLGFTFLLDNSDKSFEWNDCWHSFQNNCNATEDNFRWSSLSVLHCFTTTFLKIPTENSKERNWEERPFVEQWASKSWFLLACASQTGKHRVRGKAGSEQRRIERKLQNHIALSCSAACRPSAKYKIDSEQKTPI